MAHSSAVLNQCHTYDHKIYIFIISTQSDLNTELLYLQKKSLFTHDHYRLKLVLMNEPLIRFDSHKERNEENAC